PGRGAPDLHRELAADRRPHDGGRAPVAGAPVRGQRCADPARHREGDGAAGLRHPLRRDGAPPGPRFRPWPPPPRRAGAGELAAPARPGRGRLERAAARVRDRAPLGFLTESLAPRRARVHRVRTRRAATELTSTPEHGNDLQDHAPARARENGAPRRRRRRRYSTMSSLRLWTKATTSRCSASGTLNLASVAAA